MDGWTPLHVATYYDNYGVMSILLEAGADVFALDCDLNYPINHIMNGLSFRTFGTGSILWYYKLKLT